MATAVQAGWRVIEEAESLFNSARYRDAMSLAARSLAGAGSQDAEARLRLVRGHALWQLGSVAPGRAEVRRALERAESGEARARALEATAVLDWREQRFDQALARLDEARGAYRETGSPDGEWRTLGAEAGLLRDTGRLAEALDVLERRVVLAEERRRPADLAQARSERGVLLTALGRWEAARRDLDASVQGFLALGDPRELSLARVSRATLDIANGELATARVTLEQAREAERTGGQSPRPLAEILMLLSDLELAAGDAAAGDALAAEALSLFALVHDQRGECWARMRRVHALVALGRVEEAVREGRRAVRLGEGLRLAVAAWAQLALGRALLRSERAAAGRCFEAALERRSGRADLAHAARVGRALAGDGERAALDLGAALEGLTVWGDRRILAYCVADVRLLLGPGIAATGAPVPGPALAGVEGNGAFPEILGRCEAMRALFEEMARVAPSEIAIHITGETGTGKERVAEALHRRSRRANGPFVAVNASSLGDELFEAEMFGHARGAFTGATAAREGYVAAAEGGTLFIDELADLSPRAQAKLLRLFQEREYRRVGENEVRRADVRVLTATNADLEERVRAGAFREDLLYRLSVVTLRLPPLRERGDEDVLLLAGHFLRRAAEREGTPAAELPAEVRRALVRHSWPGNVRELENEMSRLLVLSRPGPLAAAHLRARLRGGGGPPTRFSLKDAVRGFERDFVRGALVAHSGNRSRTALALGLTRQALLNKLRRLGIA
jgi:transcriptional regulator with AAA-type ATPase domain/tetratricopeptide (TPR) repeat protein